MKRMPNADLRKLEQRLRPQGFTFEQTKGSHWVIRNAQGERIATTAGSPSDPRGVKNLRATLKRAGAVL